MSFVISTWGEDKLDLGTVAIRDCPQCNRKRLFNLWLHYSYQGAFWIFLSVRSHQYYHCCQVCQGAIPIETHTAGALGWNPPIPFFRRYGASVALLMLPILFGLAIWAKHWEKSNPPLRSPYISMKPGARWEYVGADKKSMVLQVRKREKLEGIECVEFEWRWNGQRAWTQHYKLKEDGVHLIARNDSLYRPTVCVMRHNVQKGDSWEVKTTYEGRPVHWRFVVEETDLPVETPFGKFRAVRARTEINGKYIEWSDYAPGVGLIQQTGQDAKKKRFVALTLQKYTPGK